MSPALAPLTDKYDTKYMIANVLYMPGMNAHKKSPKKLQKMKMTYPVTLRTRVTGWLSSFFFLGHIGRLCFSPFPATAPPGGEEVGGVPKKNKKI